MLASEQLASHELADAQAFIGKQWADITCDELEEHFEAIYWMQPAAFLYLLPGILLASINENRPDIIVVDSIIGMLDRSPDRKLWDDFFGDRWPLLTRNECEAVQCWTLWLSSIENSSLSQDSLSRAFDTLELLKENVSE